MSFVDSMTMPPENFSIYNGTLLEDDLFSDPIDEDLYEPKTFDRYVFYIEVALAHLKLLFCLSTVVSDVYLIVILSKFKNLRNRVNNLILLYAVLNMLYLLLGNTIMIVIRILSGRLSDGLYYYCIFDNLDHLAMTLCFYIVIFLAIDWYVQHYHPEIYGRYPRTFKYGLGIAFISLAISKCISATVMCENDWSVHGSILSLEGISFACCAIVFVCVAILKKIGKPVIDIHKTEYAFSIGKIVILMSFPAYILRPLSFSAHDYVTRSCLAILEEVAECVFFAHPMAILYLLGKQNKHFKMAYIKCCKKNVQDYVDDDLDSESVTESAEGNVRFDKTSEVIQF